VFTRTVKTLTLPAWLNKKAEDAGMNFSCILQDALKKAKTAGEALELHIYGMSKKISQFSLEINTGLISLICKSCLSFVTKTSHPVSIQAAA
jgi:hypothetical protein